ncbi:MAG TPA: sigma-70 family RNA polymerase sigma factor [Polyangiaceae bacterium]|jgi:RNA polymerase sigma-32 factor|nr:sigma-70 family RNA polymerase sigma factor [Polyangiaceae bacterium]
MTQTSSNSYHALVNRIPKLSREREHELALRWRDERDLAARDELVGCNLRHVAAVASRFRRQTSVSFDELVAEGNIGLFHALDKFDPDQGTRFITYAVYWIRAYMSQHVVRSRSLVSTGVQSKLLSKVRRERTKALARGEGAATEGRLAEQLALSPERLRSLVERLDVHDVPWDVHSEDSLSVGLSAALGLPSFNAEETALAAEAQSRLSAAVAQALSALDVRERYVVERRLMAHQGEELSLAEIGRNFAVSRERARQIETRALRKLKVALQRSAVGAEWLAYSTAA